MKNGVKFSISIFHVPDYAGSNPVSHLKTQFMISVESCFSRQKTLCSTKLLAKEYHGFKWLNTCIVSNDF